MVQSHMRNRIGGNIQTYIDEIITTIKELGPEADTKDDNTVEPAQVAAANPIVNEEAHNAVEEPEPAAPENTSWREPLRRFLINGALPQDIAEAKRISRRSRTFKVINRQLYKRGVSQVLQKCIDEEDGKTLLLEIHEGTYGHHACSRALVAKAFRTGLYWPTAMRNAEDIMRRCMACHKFSGRPHTPASEFKTIPPSWPFAIWRLHMVVPLKKSSKGGITHLLVAVNEFTKWIEAAPITSTTTLTAANLIKSIIFKFGKPHNIITDNGTNPKAEELQKLCEELGIKINYASVANPRSNGQVEKANGLICRGLKKRLLTPL